MSKSERICVKVLGAVFAITFSATVASADMICDWVGKSLVCRDTNPPPAPAFVQPDMRDHPAGGGGMPLRATRPLQGPRDLAPLDQPDMSDHPAGGGGMPLDEGE